MDSLTAPRSSFRRTPGPGTALGKYLMLYHRVPSPTNADESDTEEVFHDPAFSSQFAVQPPASPRTPNPTDSEPLPTVNYRSPEKPKKPLPEKPATTAARNSPGMFRKCLARQKSHLFESDSFYLGRSKEHRASTESGASGKHLTAEPGNR